MYLWCKDCHKMFIFSEDEQTFFASKHWSDPVRCHDCRKEHRDRQKDPYFGLMESMYPNYQKKKRYMGLQYHLIDIR